MESTEEQGQGQQERQNQVSENQTVHQENELEVIGLDQLDKIIPPIERNSEHGSELDKRASEELFNGALAEVPNTNAEDVDISDLRPEENLAESSIHEDLDYGEDDDMNVNHDRPNEATNGTSTSPNVEGGQDEQKQESVGQGSTEHHGNHQQSKQQASATENGSESQSKNDEQQSDKGDGAEDYNESGRMGRKMKKIGMDNDCEEVEYIIEKIISKKIDDDGIAKFLVKWENYPKSANTWEPLENLIGCEKALKKFELDKAKKLSKNCSDGQRIDSASGKSKNKADQRYYVGEIIGMTVIGDEKYFVISLEDSKESPKFIRSSLANKMFPDRVIDFYVKNIRWDRD